MANKSKSKSTSEKSSSGMTTSEAGKMGGNRVRELIEKGKKSNNGKRNKEE